MVTLFLNGQRLNLGADWVEVGTIGTSSHQVSVLQNLKIGDELTFRIEASVSATGGGGGGGSGSLQDAYNNGHSINVASGQPISITGTAGQKLMHIAGDIQVDGVVDPTAVTFIGQSSTPLSSSDFGLWMSAIGELMHQQGPLVTNITNVINSIISGSPQPLIGTTYINTTGSTIPAFTLVYAPTAGHIDLADGTNSSKFQVIGITTQSIADSTSGTVAYSGYVAGLSGLTHGQYVYLGLTPGTLTTTPPTLGSYPSGFNVIRVGIADGTKLIIQIQHMGVL
jgi:hypothetical protein